MTAGLRIAVAAEVVDVVGAAGSLGPLLRDRGYLRVVLLAGERTSGLPVYDRIAESLRACGVETIAVVRSNPRPLLEDVERLAGAIGEAGPRALIGVGGGSVLDLLKVAAIAVAEGVPAEAHAVRYRPGAEPEVPHLGARKLPIVAVPTTFSGSEGNGSGLIRGDAARYARSFVDDGAAPSIVVLDPIAGRGQTPRQTVASALNAFAHGVEALYTRRRSPFSDALAAESLRLLQGALPALARDPADPAGRLDAQWGSLLGGVVIRNAYVGMHHALAHALVSVGGLAHAEAHAVLLSHGIAWHLQHLPAPERTRLRERLPAGWQSALREAAERVGLPLTLRDAGLDPAKLDEVVEHALHDRGVANEVMPIESADLREVLERARDTA